MEGGLQSYPFVGDAEEFISRGKVENILCECTPLTNAQGIKSDEQRLCFLKHLRGQSRKVIEDACPTLIFFSTQKFDAPFKTAFEEFMFELLDYSDSRLVRKTCLHLLRSTFYPLAEFEPFFSLFSALEESQYHVIEPILPKLNNLSDLVKEKHLAWDYLKVVLKKMISHTNGWIRCFGFQSLTNVSVEIFCSDVNFIVFDYYKSLNSYDPFWRLDETIGVVNYIEKLRNINRQCLSESFVKSLLSLFESRFSPSPLLFLSQTLPDMNDKYLTDDDMPLIRRVISEICCLQYPNLKNEVVINFIKFLFAAFDWEGSNNCKGMVSLLTLFTFPLRRNVCDFIVKYINPRDLMSLFDGNILQNGLLELLSCLPISDFNEFTSSCDDINVKLGMAIRRHDFFEEDAVKRLLIERLFMIVEKIGNEEDYINLCLGPILSSLDVTGDIHEMLISNLENNSSNISRRGLLLLLSHCKNPSLPCLYGLSYVEELAFFHLISLSTHLFNGCFNNEIKKNIDVFSTETEKAVLFLEDCSRILTQVDSETKILLLEKCEVLAKETQKSSNFPIVCKYWIIIALSAFKEVEKVSVDSLEKIMEIGLKNPQVAFILSTQVRSYRLPDCMANMMMRLAIFGDVVKKDDLVFHLANAMAKRSDDMIYHYDKLSTMVRENAILSIFNQNNTDCFYSALIKEVIEEIVEVDKTKSRSFGLSLGHRLKTRLVLLLLLLVKQNSNNLYKEKIIALCIDTILDGSQQFSIKLPVEWILTTYCMESEEFLEEWLQKDVYFGEKRIGSVVSWMFVLLRYLKDRPQRIYEAIFRMLRWITVANFSVKCATIAVLKLLFSWHSKEMMKDPRLEFVKELVTFNPEISGNSQVVVNNIVKEPFFNDIDSDQLDLHIVFYKLPFLCGMPKDELIFEIRPSPEALEDLVDFLKEFREGALSESNVFSTLVKNKFSAPEMLSMIPEMKCNDFTEDFQQKIDPNENKFERNGKEVVVVASLINKTANLGGLCRTCEVFGASALVLSNKNIICDQNFKALSMSAEKWIPIIEVKPDELLEFLESSKIQGYKVVAAEQTSASIPLHEFEFPDKTLLLLGEEKKGVPPELIKSVDQTVEIEQFGQTRSLNVHVSASLFIYQFASQNYC